MRRLVGSLLVCAILLGGVGVCQVALTRSVAVRITNEPESHEPVDRQERPAAAASYALEITLGFTAGDDPFALRLAPGEAAPRLVVRNGTDDLYATTDELVRGRTITVPGLAFSGDVVRLFVEAVPGPEEAQHPCSLRLRLRRDGRECDAVTLWSEGHGARLSGEVQLSLVPGLDTVDRGLGVR